MFSKKDLLGGKGAAAGGGGGGKSTVKQQRQAAPPRGRGRWGLRLPLPRLRARPPGGGVSIPPKKGVPGVGP